MKAIILAAGVGKRLGESNENKPKCLIEIDGISLLQRHLKILKHYNLDEIIIVTGFQNGLIEDELLPYMKAMPIRTVYNQDFTEGSVVSFWCAREQLLAGTEIILMDADVLYAPEIIDILINSERKNCFLLDRDFLPGDEPVKLCINRGKIIEFRKVLESNLEFDCIGESVGFFKFAPDIATLLADRSQYYLESNYRDQPYEEVIRDILQAENEHFGFEDITGYPWIEIDFPEDIHRASNEILSKMNTELVH